MPDVHALIEAGRWEELEALLTNLSFLEAKALAGQVFDLVADFDNALRQMPADRPLRRLLDLLEEALRRDLHFIARHPHTLFQCLWNSCWWYDCPEAARFYNLSEGSSPWENTPRLSVLLETWRREKQKRSPGFVWLRSLRPPSVPLGSPQRLVLPIDTDHWRVVRLGFSSNQERLFAWLAAVRSAEPGSMLRAWDCRTGRELDVPDEGEAPPRDPTVSPDGRWRVGYGGEEGGWGQPVRLLDATGTEVAAFPTDENVNIQAVTWSMNGDRIAGAGWGVDGEGHVMLWDVSTHQRLAWLQPNESVFAVALSFDSRLVAWDSSGGIDLWDVQSGEVLLTLKGHECSVQTLAFAPDSKQLASAGHDGTIRVWDLERSGCALDLKGHPDSIVDLTFSTDGRRLISVSANCTTWFWDGERGTPVACPYRSDGVVLMGGAPHNGVFADGERILSLARGVTWDATTGSVLGTEPEGRFRFLGRDIVWSADGQHFATFGRYRTAVQVSTSDQLTASVSLEGHTGDVHSVAFSPGGQRLVSGSEDGTVRIWDTQTGAQVALLEGHQGPVSCVAYSPDGRQVVSGSADSTVRIWDALGGKELACLRIADPGVWRSTWTSEGCTSEVHAVSAVAFTHEARILTLSGMDRIRVWAPATGTCLETIHGRTDFQAIADGVPWRALLREGEVQVEASRGGPPVARMPFPRSLIRRTKFVAHPAGRTWASAVGNHLYLFTLES